MCSLAYAIQSTDECFMLIPASSRLVTNSSDRTLRQFNLPTYPSPSPGREFLEQELEPTRRFNDPINKTAWHAMSYSPDGEWLAGGLSGLSSCCRSLTLIVAPIRCCRSSCSQNLYLGYIQRRPVCQRIGRGEGASDAFTCE